MSFSKKIKNEILEQSFELKGFEELLRGFIITSAHTITDNSVICKITNQNIKLQLIYLCAKFDIRHGFSTEHNNDLMFDKKYYNLKEIKNPKLFYGGVFIARGSVSSIDSKIFHLEFSVNNKENFDFITNFLLQPQYNFNLKTISRKNKHVAYIKKQESISDFLLALGLVQIHLEFNNQLNQHKMEGYVSKLAHLDEINTDKIVKASLKHIKMIDFILANNYINEFSPEQMKLFEIKKNQPYLSLEGLRDGLEEEDIEISRSGINHWLRKLKKVFLDKGGVL
ncbi:hypothetical protein EI74_0361 [Mycoplasma testudineum]|uniref:Cell division protein WhiA n=1 Tax=Mycoplasma testudineum TaxID=244584 RepID=A0A4R6IHF8_9MOLU|nr:DNA-binding protein WhiA [Mycoplasma testudineum]OYD26979.1 DNA-binding protein WhiA [Mycoplasma testudineum]TDO20525.1 hypothetical protein EI74_0361 [Mycoplasma testudineum]